MCVTCGCGNQEVNGRQDLKQCQAHDHDHHHHHQHHDHGHEHPHSSKTIVELERDVLYENNLLAQRNRGFFEGRHILAINLVSSPGSGKTALLERTLNDLRGQYPFYVIEGDQHTTRDADRIHATGTKVTQINTGKGCHLDAHMVLHAVQGMQPAEHAVLFIENVGNLVCPALFDLGEQERVVMISVTEGDDKPLKYPDMFHSAGTCIINKTDLLPYVPFSMDHLKQYARQVNPHIQFIELSCLTGSGMDAWYHWLQSHTVPARSFMEQ